MKCLFTNFVLVTVLFNLNFYPYWNTESSQADKDASVYKILTSLSISEAYGCSYDDCMTVNPRYPNYYYSYWDDYDQLPDGRIHPSDQEYSDSGGGSYYMTSKEREENAKQQLGDPEYVLDVITVLAQVKDRMLRLLAEPNLTTKAREQLTRDWKKLEYAHSKANKLYDVLNTGTQAAMHIAKEEYAHAAVEVIAVIAGFTVGTLVSGPFLAIAASVGTAFVVEYAGDKIVKWFEKEYKIEILMPVKRYRSIPLPLMHWGCFVDPLGRCEQQR